MINFDVWFNENKDTITDDYHDYCKECEADKEKPMSIKEWAKMIYEDDITGDFENI